MTTTNRSSVLPRRTIHFALLAVAALGALPGQALADLFSPSVEARLGNNTGGTSAAQASGPVTLTDAGAHYALDVWTDYGINRAASSVAVSTAFSSPVSWGSAISRWTDALRVSTPDVAAGQPISLVFSVRLDGHLEGHAATFSNGALNVTFNLVASGYGSWAVQPTYRLDLGMWNGQDVAANVSEVLPGVLVVPNGVWFNLISDLSTHVETNLWGPPASVNGSSVFDQSAQWLGGGVEVNGNPATSFTIESGSGFDYTQPAVAEPSALLLFGAGLAGVGATTWRRRRVGERSAGGQST